MKSRLSRDSWVFTKPIAHRGIHDNDRIPENSMPAFIQAIEKGFPIETDVQMTRDGRLVCFHDDNMRRMTDFDEDIRQSRFIDVKDQKLLLTKERIPHFEQFLHEVNGQVPILIEIKKQLYNGIEEKVLEALKDYPGEFAIQSFDPFILKRIRELAPNIIRGQLGTVLSKTENDFKTRFAVKWLPLNHSTKPDFISYNVKNLPAKFLVTNGLPVICWTVRTRSELITAKTYATNYIFEGFVPGEKNKKIKKAKYDFSVDDDTTVISENEPALDIPTEADFASDVNEPKIANQVATSINETVEPVIESETIVGEKNEQ